MGCHTYFNNKVSCINDEDVEKLRKHHIRGIKKSYIYNCSLNEWLSSLKKDLDDLNSSYNDEEKNGDLYKVELDIINKMNSKEYFDTHRKQYVEDLEKLKNHSTSKQELLEIFDRHDLAFSIENDDYSLWYCGWGDNFRVSGYPSGSFYNSDDAIKFLEGYDNGNNIVYGYKKGMCDEIRDIIKEFFKQYPNGSIHYG